VSKNNGGSSDYYDLPRGPNGEIPTTLQQVIKWWDGKGMHWNQANIFKAAFRWDKKPDLEYNCNKIEWFAKDTLEDLQGVDDELGPNRGSQNCGIESGT